LAYDFFKNNNISMVWSQLDRLVTRRIVTFDTVILRLIGDMSLFEDHLAKYNLIQLKR
jgi:hypothetical protein